jgi:hypothetical protein
MFVKRIVGEVIEAIVLCVLVVRNFSESNNFVSKLLKVGGPFLSPMSAARINASRVKTNVNLQNILLPPFFCRNVLLTLRPLMTALPWHRLELGSALL